MAFVTQVLTVREMRHWSSPYSVWNIAATGEYHSANNPGHYDAGMNFEGKRKVSFNTFPNGIPDAHLACTWAGHVTKPLNFDETESWRPDVLYDYDGSGQLGNNNDPRYFLPYGSEGLVVNRIDLGCDQNVLHIWAHAENGMPWWLRILGMRTATMQACAPVRAYLMKRAKLAVQEINRRCADGQVKIRVVRRL